ncbi:hypothetical protein [Mariprofundus ferrooxydans]|uniref:Uncharacterized protein n=1 Tax=Mariprofundus ferrooxydans PV-1 TaxID=314345 RepID=Q0F0J7_9PROT|nr:hypothetical protein [Mariprofundus ferrooxydans]EAU55031.1 hypothetical protein SPV1_06799 [Mariprofundus ferrooxydans PV-1]KON46924.1 hypothetical protein AL013_11085 [Mariprofundus ferrooxydans]
MKSSGEQQSSLQHTSQEWGGIPADHYGYASDEERLEKRGLDDWEMVEHIPESQKRVPKWFYGVIVGVLIVAFGLSLPFWGDRPGHARPWFTMGHLYALLYFIVAGGVIYFMTTLYGSSRGGRLDSDVEHDDIDMPGHGGNK